jgi:sec-independent protein translocase protein TatB
MFGIGGTEFLVIIIVGILVLGPDHLPRLVRTFTKVMSDFRKISTDFQRAVHFEADEMDRAQKASPKKKKAKKRPPPPPHDENPEADVASPTSEPGGGATPEPDAVPPATPASQVDAGSAPDAVPPATPASQVDAGSEPNSVPPAGLPGRPNAATGSSEEPASAGVTADGALPEDKR